MVLFPKASCRLQQVQGSTLFAMQKNKLVPTRYLQWMVIKEQGI